MSQDSLKYERLVALAGWLWTRLRNNNRLFRREDLAEVDGLTHLSGSDAASRKAWERATDELASFGIRIEWDDAATVDHDPANTGAYRISGTRLSDEQQDALLTLAFSIAYRDLESTQAVKIPGAFLDGAGETLLLEANRYVPTIADAIGSETCIEFLYRDSETWREVQPVTVHYERGAWYLGAFDVDAQEPRSFRLDGIRDVRTTGGGWRADIDFDAVRGAVLRVSDRFFWGDSDVKTAVLAVDPDAELSALRLFRGLEVTSVRSDGWLVMERDYSNDENMLDAVLTMGPRTEILRPESLRSAMVEHLDGMLT